MKARTEISMQLYQLMIDRGYPEKLCDLVTRNLNTDYTATRMIGYLSQLSERNEIIKKKEAEQAQKKINEIYRFGLDIE